MSTDNPHVSPALEATAVLVDLRNFTPNLKAAPVTDHGTNAFCDLLAHFYGVCVEAATVAVECDGDDPPVYVNSTGDGVLMVFYAEDHHSRDAFLTTLLLQSALGTVCATYNAEYGRPGVPATSFGIGVESGEVCRVTDTGRGDAIVVETYIGDCINVAARAEGMTKAIHETFAIIGVNTNALLCTRLYEEEYASLMNAALEPGLDDAQRLAIYDKMTNLNRRLCLAFMQVTILKGVDEPIPLFRVATKRARPDNPQFLTLVGLLTNSPAHQDAALSFAGRFQAPPVSTAGTPSP